MLAYLDAEADCCIASFIFSNGGETGRLGHRYVGTSRMCSLGGYVVSLAYLGVDRVELINRVISYLHKCPRPLERNCWPSGPARVLDEAFDARCTT